MSNKDWDSNLSPEQNYILRQEGTESPGSSPLNNEKREGHFTAWDVEQNFLNLKLNMKVVQAGHLFYDATVKFLKLKQICIGLRRRVEYHCKKCGGHHGHIFEDGPEPTGKRYCNNGVCLIFKKK